LFSLETLRYVLDFIVLLSEVERIESSQSFVNMCRLVNLKICIGGSQATKCDALCDKLTDKKCEAVSTMSTVALTTYRTGPMKRFSLYRRLT